MKRAAVIGALVEGASIRSTERMTGIHRDTITKLLLQMGRASQRLLDERVRGVRCRRLQLDEFWGFCQKKQRNVRSDEDRSRVGDVWCWVALDPDTKLVPSHRIGKRSWDDATAFTQDLRSRVEGRVQLNTDKLFLYRTALFRAFGEIQEDGSFRAPDWGTIVKRYAVPRAEPGRYSPPVCVGVTRRVESGRPIPIRISTSHVERQHLTARMHMRRFARLTNAFSRRLENLRAATALHYCFYNFCRRHGSIKTAPAVAAGLIDQPWTLERLVEWGEVYGHGWAAPE
jgi:IS1 family transposase